MMYNPYEARSYVWIIRTLDPKNEKDKKSISHASAGFGYYIINPPEGVRKYYVVAYKHFGGLVPTGNQLATPEQSQKLDKMDSYRYWRESDHSKQLVA